MEQAQCHYPPSLDFLLPLCYDIILQDLNLQGSSMEPPHLYNQPSNFCSLCIMRPWKLNLQKLQHVAGELDLPSSFQFSPHLSSNSTISTFKATIWSWLIPSFNLQNFPPFHQAIMEPQPPRLQYQAHPSPPSQPQICPYVSLHNVNLQGCCMARCSLLTSTIDSLFPSLHDIISQNLNLQGQIPPESVHHWTLESQLSGYNMELDHLCLRTPYFRPFFIMQVYNLNLQGHNVQPGHLYLQASH